MKPKTEKTKPTLARRKLGDEAHDQAAKPAPLTSIAVLTVPGAADAKAISWQSDFSC